MDSTKEMQMKQHVLNMLKDFMMGEESKKFAPKAISVEMEGKPKGKEGLKDLLEQASEDNPVDDEELDSNEVEDDEDEDDMPKKMSLKDFLANR